MTLLSLTSIPSESVRTRTFASRGATLLLLGALVWVTDFYYASEFGLYEDDWARVPRALELDLSGVGQLIATGTYGQGRPLHDGLIYLLSHAGMKLGGLRGIYFIAYLIVATNVFLFYKLLDEVFLSAGFALLGAIAFALFPADTTKHFLTHSLGVQPSATFLLIALHAYASGHVLRSYAVGSLSLFAYEPMFTVLCAAPLLGKERGRRLFEEARRHVLVIAGILIVVALLRKLAGEQQVSRFGLLEMLLAIGNPIMGPITAAAMYLYRPAQAVASLTPGMLGILFACFAAISFALLKARVGLRLPPPAADLSNASVARTTRLRIPAWMEDLVRPAAAGLAMLLLAYPLTLTTAAFSVAGRGTRVHAAANLGASLLAACACSLAVRVSIAHGKKIFATLCLAGFLALLVASGLIVQRDYAMGWAYQRSFWTDLLALCPDVTDRTAILVEPSGLTDNRQLLFLRKELLGRPDTRQIKFLEDPYEVLPHVVRYPSEWNSPPRVYRLSPDWRQHVTISRTSPPTMSVWNSSGEQLLADVDSSNVIFLETAGGKLTRRTEPMLIGDQYVRFKDGRASAPQRFAERPVYRYLIRGAHEPPVDYLAK